MSASEQRFYYSLSTNLIIDRRAIIVKILFREGLAHVLRVDFRAQRIHRKKI